MEIAYPFHVDGRGRSAPADANEHIRQMIEQVLFTAPGERVNRPEFGTGLLQLEHEAWIDTEEIGKPEGKHHGADATLEEPSAGAFTATILNMRTSATGFPSHNNLLFMLSVIKTPAFRVRPARIRLCLLILAVTP